jgi:hypothetical protein
MKKIIFLIITLLLVCGACSEPKDRSTAVYMLLDTSGTYAAELKKAQALLNYLLGTLQPGDALAVARIDTGSFSEKDIIAKVTFDQRPSLANNQKRAFQKKIDEFVATVKESPYTDVSGGVLQAIEYLNETGAGKKYILLFSDLQEELAKDYIRDVPFNLDGFKVIALNVTKLRADNQDPKKYMERVADWQNKVEKGKGEWKHINDLDHLERIFER